MRHVLMVVAALMLVGCGGSDEGEMRSGPAPLRMTLPIDCAGTAWTLRAEPAECCEAGAFRVSAGCAAEVLTCDGAAAYRVVGDEWWPVEDPEIACRH